MRVTATIVERPGPRRPGVWAGFVIPDDVIEEMAGELARTRKRLPVAVTLRGYTYRSSITRQTDGWEFLASLAFRDKTGTDLGDAIEADIALDTSERRVEPPDDLRNALDASPAARRWWDAQTYSGGREALLYLDDARTPEGRAKRIATAVRNMERHASEDGG